VFGNPEARSTAITARPSSQLSAIVRIETRSSGLVLRRVEGVLYESLGSGDLILGQRARPGVLGSGAFRDSSSLAPLRPGIEALDPRLCRWLDVLGSIIGVGASLVNTSSLIYY
jgi:hypothetical protein